MRYERLMRASMLLTHIWFTGTSIWFITTETSPAHLKWLLALWVVTYIPQALIRDLRERPS
jgi:hypothetical protein